MTSIAGCREYTDSANVRYVHYVMSCPMIRHDMNMEVLNMNMFIMSNDNEYQACFEGGLRMRTPEWEVPRHG